jgi:hypothetical protein
MAVRFFYEIHSLYNEKDENLKIFKLIKKFI